MNLIEKGVCRRMVPRVLAVDRSLALFQCRLHLLHLIVPSLAVARQAIALGQTEYAGQRQQHRHRGRGCGRAAVLQQKACQQQQIQNQRMARAFARAVHQHQRQKNDARGRSGAPLPEHRAPPPGIPCKTGQHDAEQQKEQQIISAAALGKIRKDRLPDGLQRPHQLMDDILQRFDRVTVEKLLHGGHVHIREEVGRVKFRHQHQRAAQRDCTARNAHRDAAPVMPRQRQWVKPKHGLIRAHQSSDGTKQAERAPCGAAFIPPGQNTAAQHRQHKRIVKRLLHGGENIAYRCVEGGQRGSKDCLLLAVQPCSPREKGPPCNHKQQIAPQKSILPAQE